MGRSDYRIVVSGSRGGDVTMVLLILLFGQTLMSTRICSPDRDANSYAFYILVYGVVYHYNYLSFIQSLPSEQQTTIEAQDPRTPQE